MQRRLALEGDYAGNWVTAIRRGWWELCESRRGELRRRDHWQALWDEYPLLADASTDKDRWLDLPWESGEELVRSWYFGRN